MAILPAGGDMDPSGRRHVHLAGSCPKSGELCDFWRNRSSPSAVALCARSPPALPMAPATNTIGLSFSRNERGAIDEAIARSGSVIRAAPAAGC